MDILSTFAALLKQATADGTVDIEALDDLVREVRGQNGGFTATFAEAKDDFLQHVRATLAPMTAKFYESRLAQFEPWLSAKEISLQELKLRHLSEYLVEREKQGVSRTTRRHDTIVMKRFSRYCAHRGHIRKDVLANHDLIKADDPYIYCPDAAECLLLLQAVEERNDPVRNPNARSQTQAQRAFYVARDSAIIAFLLETGARPGELLAVTMDRYQSERRQIVFTKTKSNRTHAVPLSDLAVRFGDRWLKVRKKTDADTDLLFFSVTGGKIDSATFSKQFQKYVKFGGLPHITPRSCRHYAVTTIANKAGLLPAQQIAAHRDPKTTLRYYHAQAEPLRQAHADAAPLESIVVDRIKVTRPKPRIV